MHTDQEYTDALRRVLDGARDLAHAAKDGEAIDVFRFCICHGYAGFPTDSPDRYSSGNWFRPEDHGGRPGPQTTDEARGGLGIIACFRDDIAPCQPVAGRRTERSGLGTVLGAYVSVENRLLVVADVELYAPVELGMLFLHEGRHARQYFGEPFEALPPLDPPTLHEARTWVFQFRLLDAVCGPAWHEAVRQELEAIRPVYRKRRREPGERFFASSNRYWPTLDEAFGPTEHQAVRAHRMSLTGIRANFALAEEAGGDCTHAYWNIVGRYYEWVREHQNRAEP